MLALGFTLKFDTIYCSLYSFAEQCFFLQTLKNDKYILFIKK